MKKIILPIALLLLAGCAGLESGDHMIISPYDGQTISSTTRTWSILVNPPKDYDVDRITFLADSNTIGEKWAPQSTWSWEWNVSSSYTNGQAVLIGVRIESKLAPSVDPLEDQVTVYIR